MQEFFFSFDDQLGGNRHPILQFSQQLPMRQQGQGNALQNYFRSIERSSMSTLR